MTIRTCLALAALLLAGCATGPVIDTSHRAKSQANRIKFVVLHYTVGDFPGAFKILTEGGVSSHYLVRDDPPTVYQLVDESREAHHAGISYWRGYTMLNATSIGIEIVNQAIEGDPPETGIFPEYPKAQADAVVALVKDIVKRHGIRPEFVVGHSDIAPQRKKDPGPKFFWKRLADEGLIRWPDAAAVAQRQAVFANALPDVAWFQEKLAQHGFAVPRNGELDAPTRNVLVVFQMKYRPARFDGTPDAETAAILDVLVNP